MAQSMIMTSEVKVISSNFPFSSPSFGPLKLDEMQNR